MPIEVEKIQEYTGIKADTTEQFIDEFKKKFYTEEQVHKDPEVHERFFGRAFGSEATKAVQVFADEGIEFTKEERGLKIAEIVKLGKQRIAEKHQAALSELEKTAGLTADEKIQAATEQLKQAQKKVADFQDLLKNKTVEFESTLNGYKAETKKNRIEGIRKDAFSAITWNPDKDEYSRKGFISEFNEKYEIDLDEQETPVIRDRATGKQIPADGIHGTFMNPAQVFKRDAEKALMAAINKKAGTPPATPAKNNFTPPVQPNQNNHTFGAPSVRLSKSSVSRG